MTQEPISLEPQIIQFGPQSKQYIKIVNRTGEKISNCFFCLFNTSKYQFNPQHFELNPYEHKIVTVTMLKDRSSCKPKQFAYIKSKNFSKRITLMSYDLNPSQQKLRSPTSDYQDVYTLSSRDYKVAQKEAYDRVIAEKQAYIKRLERRLEEQEQSQRKDRSFTSDRKRDNIYMVEIEDLQNKLLFTGKQKEALANQNVELRNKIKKLESIVSSSGKKEEFKQLQKIIQSKQQLISKMKQDIHFLQAQCENLFLLLSQKQQIIKNFEIKNTEIINQIKRDHNKRIKQLEMELQQQRRKYQSQNKTYKFKVKKLEDKINESQVIENKKNELQDEIDKKQRDLNRLSKKLEEQKRLRKQYEEDVKRVAKVQNHNEILKQENSILRSRVQVLQKSVDDMKQQTFLIRSKVDPSQKQSRYLQVALQSCKNENELLKKSRNQAEHSLMEEVRNRKNYQMKVKQLELEVKRLKQQINQLKYENEEISQRGKISRDESHETIMKLRAENIDLIEKMSFGHSKDSQLEKQLKESRNKILESEEARRKQMSEKQRLLEKVKQSEQVIQKLNKKLDKYKKQTKRQLKNLTESTLDELKKAKQEKKQLKQKVTQLEKTIREQRSKSKDKTVAKLAHDSIALNLKNQVQTRYPATQSDRRTGIRNQRKQIEESHSYSRNEADLENVYYELGQLREFKNFVEIEMGKVRKILSMDSEVEKCGEPNSIFSIINLFELICKRLQEKDINHHRFAESVKQIQYLKGRLFQLQNNYKYGKELGPQVSEVEGKKLSGDQKLLEMVKEQMKSQYKKMYDSLKISQDRFELLKKKIYEEYRMRIIGILNGKQNDKSDPNRLSRLQSVLERFVQNLGNKSHKQALLAKEIRLKQEARKQVSALREKVNYFNKLLQYKKGYCTREPIKVFQCQNQPQLHDNIRLQAKMLTYQAQNQRLIQQVNLLRMESKGFEDQLKLCLTQMQIKEDQILRLKKQVIQVKRQSQQQLLKRQQDIEQLEKRFMKENVSIQNQKRSIKEKQMEQLKEDINRKKEIIKNLKQKERMLEQLIESSNRSDQSSKTKGRKQLIDEIRMQESLQEFKQNNRDLRAQNTKLKEEMNNLKEELDRKIAANKRMRNEAEESRIKIYKQDHEEIEKLKAQNKQLKEELKSSRTESQKIGKKKEKLILQLQSELKKLRNEYIIEKSSLESIIRALCDSIRRLYSDLHIIVRKRGFKIEKQINFQELLSKPGQIDSLKVYEGFESLLEAFKS